MTIVGDDVLGISGNCTVNKLVVVDILLYQAKMDVGLLEFRSMQAGDGFHDVVGNLLGGLLCKNLLVLNQYLGINTQSYFTEQHTCPYLVVRAVGWQSLQEAVGVKEVAEVESNQARLFCRNAAT